MHHIQEKTSSIDFVDGQITNAHLTGQEVLIVFKNWKEELLHLRGCRESYLILLSMIAIMTMWIQDRLL